jgi:hypothetical protein
LRIKGRRNHNAGRRLLGNLLTGWNIRLGGVLAQLQGSYVGRDCPAVLRWNLFRVVGHVAKTIGHDVEEIADWGLPQTLGVVRRRPLKTTLYNHAVAVAQFRVAGRAVDVEALLSARHHLVGNGKRHVVAVVAAYLAGIEVGVGLQMPARHRTLNHGPR